MRLLAILVLLVMGLPIASPLLALSGSVDGHLPACCRRAGRHHCSGMAATDAATPQLGATAHKCPLYPQASVAVPHNVATPPAARALYASIASHPAGIAQTESKWRVSRYRSRQKRGPPAHLS